MAKRGDAITQADIWAEIDRDSRIVRCPASEGWRTCQQLGTAWGCSWASARRRAEIMVKAGTLEKQQTIIDTGRSGTVYRPVRAKG